MTARGCSGGVSLNGSIGYPLEGTNSDIGDKVSRTIVVPQAASKRGPLSQLEEFTACAINLGSTLGQKAAILWRLSKNARVRLGLARYHPERIYALLTRYGRAFLRDNFGDVTNLPDLFYRCDYGVRQVKDEGAILDVGANIGLFAAWMSYHNPDKPIYCFEPLAGNVRMIPLNCPSAVVTQVAVGREHAAVRLRVDQHDIMATSVPTPWATEEEEFQVEPLDKLIREHGIEHVALMKIDTEGMELDILDGARETLKHTTACAIETHGRLRHAGVVDRLRAAGFAITRQEFGGSTGLVLATALSTIPW